MALSALDFNISRGETSFFADLKVSDGGLLRAVPSAMPVAWGISAANIITQVPINDAIDNTDWWFSKKIDIDNNNINNNYSIGSVANIKTLSTRLYPTLLQNGIGVDNLNYKQDLLPIMPYLSGATSFWAFTTANNFLGRGFEVANTLEVQGLSGLLTSTPPSAILSGFWYFNTTTSGRDVSGLLDYHSGQLWLDFSRVPTNVYPIGLSSIYVKYEGNYVSGINVFQNTSYTTSGIALTTERLRFHSYDDVTSYYISAHPLKASGWDSVGTPIAGHTYIFHPYRIDIQEKDYDFTNATLSAVYFQRDTNYNLNFNSKNMNSWPFNSTSGRAIVLSASSPNVTFSLPNSDMYLHTGPISGWSTRMDKFIVSATGNTPTQYTINAYFPEKTLTNRITATYTFNYNPPSAEDLKILTLSQDLTSENIRVYRQVYGTDGSIYYVAPKYPLVWNLLTSNTSTVTACSGVVPSDLTIERYYNERLGVSLTGVVGLVSSVNLYSGSGVLTGTNDYYGVDYLRIKYDPNPDLLYTFSVAYSGNPFVGSVSSYDTHTFQVYSSASNIVISALGFDNQSFNRRLTAKAMKDKGGGVHTPLHAANKIIWKISSPDSTSYTAYKTDGTVYDFNSYSDDTLILDIETSTFDMSSTYPTLCSFVLYASAYNTYNNPTLYMTNTSYNFNVDTFPATSIFDSYLKVNSESSKNVTDMWRVSSASYNVTAYDATTINGNNIVEGKRLITFGNGVTSDSVFAIENYDNLGKYPITLTRSDVSAAGWLSAHKIVSEINLNLLERFLVADFELYPTYVFAGSGSPYINTIGSPITSFGVSSYDVNHNEPYILSAYDHSGSTYLWNIANDILLSNSFSAIYTTSTITPPSGSIVKLQVYDDEMTLGMPETYVDDNGNAARYPNVKQTDNSSVLFEHIKVKDYDDLILTITNHTSGMLMPANLRITATENVQLPTNVPIIEKSSLLYWTLSTPNWYVDYVSDTFDYTVSLGNNDSIPGVIKYDATYPLVLVLNRKTNTTIPNTYPPYDWGVRSALDTTSVNITYSAAPDLLFTPTKRYNLLNENISFVNATNHSNLVTGFYVNDGLSNTNLFVSAFDDFVTSYNQVGTYGLSITGLLINGSRYTNYLQNIVTILSSFQEFDPDVSRIFGATELQLPYDLETCKIKPNEWATDWNFNRSINLLENNLEYLKNMTDYYSLPPIEDIGWMGSTTTGVTTAFSWHYKNLSNFISTSAAISNHVLSAVNDVVNKGNYVYVADGQEVKIFDMRYNPNLLNTITKKTLDDYISLVKRIAVDSDNRVYVLDSAKNRVVVFGPYLSNNPNSNRFLFEFGGLGGPNARSKFNNPNDMYLDSNNNIWICDTANRMIKKYTRSGSWLQSIDISKEITDNIIGYGAISLTIDSKGDIHVLTRTKVFKYDSDGNYITSYTYPNPHSETPQKIITMNGGGFVYICLQTSIVKCLENGLFAGMFADNISGADYMSIFHDVDNEFFVASRINVLKFFESHVINTSRETEADKYLWNIDSLSVKKDEMISDFVINMRFKRLWDNIELFRRSLKGKIEYISDSNGLNQISIRNFTPSEYIEMQPIDVSEIFVGVNEILTSDVINRCITQIWETLNNIKKHA